MGLQVSIGHTALTWGVLDAPERLKEAVTDCAEFGYGGTETAGTVYDWWESQHRGELKRILQSSGIVMACLFQCGTWTDIDQRKPLMEAARLWSAAVRDLGGDILMVVPGGARDEPPYSLDEYLTMAETMNRVGAIAREYGVTAAMHPHWGTTAETRLEIELLLSNLDPDLVGFAPDGGQIAKGGADPIAVARRWADRIRHVHLKGLEAGWVEKRRAGISLRGPEGYCELGEGVIDYAPLVEILAEVGFRGWVMAELDETSNPPREVARRNRDQLRELFGV